MVIARQVCPSGLAQNMCSNRCRWFTLPASSEYVNLVPARAHCRYGCQAIFLQTAEWIVIIERKTNFHLDVSEHRVHLAAMRKAGYDVKHA